MVRRPVSPIGLRVEIFANDQWASIAVDQAEDLDFIKFAATEGACSGRFGNAPAHQCSEAFLQSVENRSDKFLAVNRNALMGAVLNARRYSCS